MASVSTSCSHYLLSAISSQLYTQAREVCHAHVVNHFRPEYSSSPVKQAIARQRLLPFWAFFEQDKGSPKGGLFLHWLFTSIMILGAPVGPEGYGFIVGLYTYGQIVVISEYLAATLVSLR
jgi:hypothetical protein